MNLNSRVYQTENELNMRAIGEYIPGKFLMKYYGINFAYEAGLFMSTDIGDSKDDFAYSSGEPDAEIFRDGFWKTYRIETILHECNHYLQDMSIPACIVNDYLKDEVSFFLKLLLNESDKLKFPLMEKENADYNRTILSKDFQKVYDVLFDRETINYVYFQKKHKSFSYYKEYNYLFDDGEEISYTDLLEGHAHYKTILDLISRGITSGKTEYLRDYKDASKLIPYYFDGEKIDFTNILNGNLRTYHIARFLYMKTIRFDLKNAFNYLKHDWPDDYHKSNLAIHDIGFLMCLDIALTIPPLPYIISLVNKGLYNFEDFSPVHRYKIILDIIDKNGGYPDAVEGEKFYVTLFNFLSTKSYIKWPNYIETIESWKWCFRDKIEQGHDTSDGYRITSFFHKLHNPNRYYLSTPTTICSESLLPIFIIVKGGALKIIYFHGNIHLPFEGVFSVYELFNKPFYPWEPNEEKTSHESLEKEQKNQQSFIREITYRSICRDIQTFIGKSRSFFCSFYNEEFYNYFQQSGEDKPFNPELPPALFCNSMDKTRCCDVKDLNSLPGTGCAVRDYLRLFNYKIENINL